MSFADSSSSSGSPAAAELRPHKQASCTFFFVSFLTAACLTLVSAFAAFAAAFALAMVTLVLENTD